MKKLTRNKLKFIMNIIMFLIIVCAMLITINAFLYVCHVPYTIFDLVGK